MEFSEELYAELLAYLTKMLPEWKDYYFVDETYNSEDTGGLEENTVGYDFHSHEEEENVSRSDQKMFFALEEEAVVDGKTYKVKTGGLVMCKSPEKYGVYVEFTLLY